MNLPPEVLTTVQHIHHAAYMASDVSSFGPATPDDELPDVRTICHWIDHLAHAVILLAGDDPNTTQQ